MYKAQDYVGAVEDYHSAQAELKNLLGDYEYDYKQSRGEVYKARRSLNGLLSNRGTKGTLEEYCQKSVYVAAEITDALYKGDILYPPSELTGDALTDLQNEAVRLHRVTKMGLSVLYLLHGTS